MKENVIQIIKDVSGLDSINESDSLLDDLVLDSLALVTLLITIEDVFEIELDEADMNPMDLKLVSDVIKMVAGYLSDEE